MNYYCEFPVDPAMIILKKLSKSDLIGNVKLPKKQVMSVFKKMEGVTDETLLNGIEVKVLDLAEANPDTNYKGDEYTVTLRGVDNDKFYFGDGWSTMKYSMDLNEGETLKLYWDYLQGIFIVLNIPYLVMEEE
ncbi:B3 domain-containing protein At1g43171 [Eutrema salsugineum]|nr:B3 domain-containing protein At1g43171 [Eutrema salsugineum]